MMNGVNEIISRIKALPPLSPHTVRIMDLASRPDYRIRDLADLIMLDVTLSALCLRAANSARFGLRRPVDTIEQAVAYLGSREVLRLAIQEGMPSLTDTPLTGYRGEDGEYWAHSLRTAIASAAVARLLFPGESPGAVYAAGLLHDMGKAVLSEFLSRRSPQVSEGLSRGAADFLDLERELLAIDHAGAGALAAERWGLPAPLTAAVRWHHEPAGSPGPYRNLCCAVHIGDLLAMLGGCGTGCDTLAYRVDPSAHTLLGPHAEHLPRLMLDIETEFSAAHRRLGALRGASDNENHPDRR